MITLARKAALAHWIQVGRERSARWFYQNRESLAVVVNVSLMIGVGYFTRYLPWIFPGWVFFGSAVLAAALIVAGHALWPKDEERIPKPLRWILSGMAVFIGMGL